MKTEETIQLLSLKQDENDDDDQSATIEAQYSETHQDQEKDEGQADNENSRKPLTWRQYFIFAVLGIMDMSILMLGTVPAAVFPFEGEKRNLSSTENGLIFGIFAIVSLIVSPLLGKYLPVIGARFMFISGSFLAAGCNILYGFLNMMPGKTTFLVFAYLLRIFEAIGAAGACVAIYAIIAVVFPNNVAQMIGTLEMFFGIGVSLGPPIGSFFYGIGGYTLPFLVVGGFTLSVLGLSILAMLNLGSFSDDAKPGSLSDILKLPAIWLMLLSAGAAVANASFLDPNLGLHITSPPLNLSATFTGLFFLFASGIYGILSPIFGHLADKITPRDIRALQVIGCILRGIGYMLLGPSPVLHIEGRTWIIFLALGIDSVGTALTVALPFLDMLITTRWHGIPDNQSTQSIVAGLYSCAVSIGVFLGATGGGALIDYFGFKWTATQIAGLDFALGVVVLLFSIWEFQCGRERRKPARQKSTP